MSQNVLALNASYEPLKLVGLEDAMRLVLQGKAEVVEEDHDRPLRSQKLTLPRPLVIRLKRFIRVPAKFRRGVTNTFLFARDQYACQYCGRSEEALGKREYLNRDHIEPQSRGGKNTWDNCVTACSTCNERKADRTPNEAGMKLRSIPTEPHLVHLKWKVRHLTELQKKYITMFYGDELAAELW